MYKKVAASIFILATIPFSASAYDPDGFHECILDNVKENMGGNAVAAIRQACAHQNKTTASGERPRPSASENSYVNRIKIRNPNLKVYTDREIIEAILRKHYPSEPYSTVREWLTRDMEIHGPPPGLDINN